MDSLDQFDFDLTHLCGSWGRLAFSKAHMLTGIFAHEQLNLIVVPETNKEIILSHKARRLRHETGNWLLLAERDLVKLDMMTFINKTITLPIQLLIKEPVLLTIATYNSFAYGLLYSFFEAFRESILALFLGSAL